MLTQVSRVLPELLKMGVLSGLILVDVVSFHTIPSNYVFYCANCQKQIISVVYGM